MATRKPLTPLSRAELRFWQQVFLTAQLPVLLKGNGKRLSAISVAHLAADYAHAAVGELRRAQRGTHS